MLPTPLTRFAKFQQLFPTTPVYRWRQIETILYTPGWHTWTNAHILPTAMRTAVAATLPWMTITVQTVLASKKADTYKALCRTIDGGVFETVLMANARGDWTICVSSQIGCAMGCVFCATGAMGLTRSLTADEIGDQYRLWRDWLAARPDLPPRISNVVFMGMGEPLANYDAVKETIITWLAQTDLGHTHITVSTVGLLPQLEKLLADPTWPPVRLAVSLHSADAVTRKNIVPTSVPNFLDQLAVWAKRFLAADKRRRNHLTFEHVMLAGINDSPAHAKVLAEFANHIGQVKINLIPYNPTGKPELARTATAALNGFKTILEDNNVTVMIRRTMGDDIAAACGQLATRSVESSTG